MDFNSLANALQSDYPHYRHGDILLLNADCMDVMARIPDKLVDLACCDVPYGIGEDGSKNHTRGSKKAEAKNYKAFAGNDKEPPKQAYFEHLQLISRNQILWGANHFISRIPFDSSCWIVWDKDNGGNDFADCELAWTSFKTAVRKFQYRWNGMLQQNMRNKEARIHPTQKPRALYDYLLTNYAKPGQIIFDSHGGSFSSAIAAHYYGVKFIGCELDKFYFAEAVKRFKRETAQVDLMQEFC